jgi:hypothetical protein
MFTVDAAYRSKRTRDVRAKSHVAVSWETEGDRGEKIGTTADDGTGAYRGDRGVSVGFQGTVKGAVGSVGCDLGVSGHQPDVGRHQVHPRELALSCGSTCRPLSNDGVAYGVVCICSDHG